MKRMAFSYTPEQMRDRIKTVTRRDAKTWQSLKAGDVLMAVEKSMGLKPGEKQVKIGPIRVVDVRVERWDQITDEDVAREGFPGKSATWFLEKVARDLGVRDTSLECRRIEFEFIEE